MMLVNSLIIAFMVLPFLLWGTENQVSQRVEIGPSGVQLINDPDLNLEEESLQIVLDHDEVLAVCLYTLKNQSNLRKVFNFTFNIPITADQISEQTVSRYLISYGINVNDQPADARTIYDQYQNKRTLIVQKISQVRVNPRATVYIQVLYRVYAGLDRNFNAASQDRPMAFKYAFFPSRESGQPRTRRLRLTLAKTPIMENQGKILSIEGIPLRDDPRQGILVFSANEFHAGNNPILTINYSIKGYSSSP